MSQTLTALRSKYPAYNDLSDEDLVAQVGSKYPTYLQSDPDFAKEYESATTKAKPAQQAPFKGLARGVEEGAGAALRGAAFAGQARLPANLRQMMTGAQMTTAPDVVGQPAAQEALAKAASPGDVLRRTMASPTYQTGAELTKLAAEEHPLTPQEERGFFTKAGRMAGEFVPIIASGPLAPATIGVEAMGSHISNDYEEAKRQGKSDEEAASIAVNRAATSGMLQAGIFSALPKPLRAAAERFIVGRFGQSGLARWASGRLAAASEGAALGGSSGAAEALLSGRPLSEAIPAAAGLAGANVLLPWLRERTPNAIPTQSKQVLPTLREPPGTRAPQVPAESGSAPTGERGGQAQQPQAPVGKPADRQWQVTVQGEQKYTKDDKTTTVPGFVQIDDITGGQNHWSMGPDNLAKEGVEVPDFSKLPPGKYSWEEAVKLLRETAKQRGGRVDVLTTEDDFLAAERQAIEEAEKQGSPVEVLDRFKDSDPNLPFALKFMRATPQRIEIERAGFREWLRRTPPDQRAEAIRKRISEEHIHRHVSDEDALAYHNSLTALEKAMELRQYTGYWTRGKLKAAEGVELTDTQLGHEAIRRRLQRLMDGTTSETAEAALKERWTLRSLDVMQDLIRGAREKLGTKASREGIAALDRAAANVAAAKAALGDTPAAYNKRRGKKQEQEPTMALTPLLPGETREAVATPQRPKFEPVKAGYEHLEQVTQKALADYDAGKSKIEPISFEKYREAIQEASDRSYADLPPESRPKVQPGQIRESFLANLYSRLFNASGRSLEALSKSLGLKSYGKVSDPARPKSERMPPLMPHDAFPEFRAEAVESRQLARETAEGKKRRDRNRIRTIASIADPLITQALEATESKPTRAKISIEDLRISGKSEEPQFWEVSQNDLKNPKTLGERLAKDARRSKRDPVTLTKRLTLLLDKQTGKSYLVSTYAHGRTGAMLLDPSVSTVKAHRPLGELLDRYRPVASLLLDDPVRNFRQAFDSIGDFERQIGKDARRLATTTNEPPLGEGEQEVAGSWESGAPITDNEASGILYHILQTMGRFDSPEDVKASLDSIREDLERHTEQLKKAYQTKQQGYIGMPESLDAVRRALSGYRKLADKILAKNPDLSNEGVKNQLAQQIYDNYRATESDPSADLSTFVRRTMAQGGAEDRQNARTGQDARQAQGEAQTGKELTMPLERVPPTTLRPEQVPPGSLAPKKPAPPVPEGTTVPAKSEPPAAFMKAARGAWDELYDRAASEVEAAKAGFQAAPSADLIRRSVDDAENRTNNYARNRENAVRIPSNPQVGPIGRIIGVITGKQDYLRAAKALLSADAIDANYNIINTRKGQLTTFKRMVRTGLQYADQMARTGQVPPNLQGITGMTASRIRRIGRAWGRSNRELLKELTFAYDHWDDPVLRQTAVRAKQEFEAQYAQELAAGKDLANDPNYVPGRYDAEMWLHNSIFFPERSKVWGQKWKAAKKFQSYYHAAEAGPYIPATFDLASLVGHRIRQGMRQLNRTAAQDSWKQMNAHDGRPVAIEPTARTGGGWISPDKSYESIGDGLAKPLLIHPDYARVVKQLVGSNEFFETHPVMRSALHMQQMLKHALLIGDFFHLGRMFYYGYSSMGLKPGFRGGWTTLEIPVNDLRTAVQKGLISREDAEWGMKPVQFGGRTITRRELAGRLMGATPGEPVGLNVGRIQDALYKDLLTQLSPAAGPIRKSINKLLDPTIGKYNRFLFDKVTRGLMVETAVREFERQSAKLPGTDPYKLMRDIARDTNNYYGNIGRQGFFKSKDAQDWARLFMLAPQWVEGLIKKEVVGASRLTGISKVTGQRQGLTALGTTGQAIARGLLAMFAITQAINIISRGKPTFMNEEKGHALDAYIPAFGSTAEGFWFSPLAVFAELSHDLYRYLNRTDKNFADAVQQISGNKQSAITRALLIGATGYDATGRKYVTTSGRAKAIFDALTPWPITFSKIGRFAASKVGLASPPPPGQIQRQITATLGLKVEPLETARGEMYDAAKRFMEKTGRKKETGWEQIQTEEASYSKLRTAIRNGDQKEAKSLYDELKKSHKMGEIRKAMMPFTVARIPGTDQYERHYKPFTGSAKNENAFKRTLTAEQRARYDQARRDSDDQWKRFKALQEQWERQ